ncbi:hypothetical protein [Yersinia pseudotuberculosis]|uniref:hypothetical protein n=1 Tax=Yersinia pseudotuberculosis TaxID=633 RepID=UPI001A9D3C74|nr:hypothetical protein [Yersinia pseudotuberculosis]MBO1561834.1 hypothetical protein [Yersinia pseudotuberculosis]
MGKLTAAEKKWVKEVNALLAKCPSKRIGFYTIGDNNVMLYDAEQFKDKGLEDDHRDLIAVLADHGLAFGQAFDLDFPNAVEGVCG